MQIKFRRKIKNPTLYDYGYNLIISMGIVFVLSSLVPLVLIVAVVAIIFTCDFL